jgi:6-pyruvoyl-tetrahydropterin synthase
MPTVQSSIFVEHNAEIAHRLMNLPGKCQNIHGHSLIISLQLDGELNKNGILAGLDFGSVKKLFREYIDTRFDHHLLLNKDDPWANQLRSVDQADPDPPSVHYTRLPGLQTTPGDPTTENIAVWICDWAVMQFTGDDITAVNVLIRETGTNGAQAQWSREGE